MGTVIGLSGITADGISVGLGDYGGFPPSNVTVLELLLHSNPRPVAAPSPSCCENAQDHEAVALGIEADAEPGRQALQQFLDKLALGEQSQELLATTRTALYSARGMSTVTYVIDCSNAVDDGTFPHTRYLKEVASDCKRLGNLDPASILERCDRGANYLNSLEGEQQYWACVEAGLEMFIYTPTT